MRPESANIDVRLRHPRVSNQEPQAEDGLGKDVKDGIGDNLTVNADFTGAVGNTPDTGEALRSGASIRGA
jgi:hypothetical protein